MNYVQTLFTTVKLNVKTKYIYFKLTIFLSYVDRSTKSFSKGPMQWHEPRARGHGMSRSCNHA